MVSCNGFCEILFSRLSPPVVVVVVCFRRAFLFKPSRINHGAKQLKAASDFDAWPRWRR